MRQVELFERLHKEARLPQLAQEGSDSNCRCYILKIEFYSHVLIYKCIILKTLLCQMGP
jgi:hypothetical protein